MGNLGSPMTPPLNTFLFFKLKIYNFLFYFIPPFKKVQVERGFAEPKFIIFFKYFYFYLKNILV